MITKQQAFILPSGGNAVFYRPVGTTTEIRSGYLFKSPPPKLLKTEVTESAQWMQYIAALYVWFLLHFIVCFIMFLLQKSWKKRYFVLFKISEQEYQLKYFRCPEEKDKPLGGIDLSQYVLFQITIKHKEHDISEINQHIKLSLYEPMCMLFFSLISLSYF